MENKNKKKYYTAERRKDLIFCLLVIAVPMLQFAIFYIGVNINSFSMIFQRYEIDPITNRGYYVWNGLKNFETMINELRYGKVLGTALENSFLAFFCITFVGVSLALIFSLYIFRKMPGSGFFKVLLFAPSMLSSIVTVTMFKYFAEGAIPVLLNTQYGLLSNPDTTKATILFFNVWIGFGTQILMYSGAMNALDKSITEAAKLDGASPFREFFSIILPLIFPTVETFLVTGVAGIFVNQINLFSFYGRGAKADLMTIGYYLFKSVDTSTGAEYPLLATYGASLTLIAAPLTLLSRYLLEKFGPKTD